MLRLSFFSCSILLSLSGWSEPILSECVSPSEIRESSAVLYRGGVFDFENGFTMHRPSRFATRDWDEVGNGWGFWGQRAVFMPRQDRYGHPSFNQNRFSPNVSSGTHSQEITLTSANGDAIMWMNVRVPIGHRITCSLDAITTPSEDNLQLRHGIHPGAPILIPKGPVDPFELGISWEEWDIHDTNNHFATYSASAVSATDEITYYFWVRHGFATSSGATLCFDNLVVWDEGAVPSVSQEP